MVERTEFLYFVKEFLCVFLMVGILLFDVSLDSCILSWNNVQILRLRNLTGATDFKQLLRNVEAIISFCFGASS